MTKAKPFDISKREVWEAFKRVKANQGAAGVDGQSIAAFESKLADNLYKLWNRLSSGSYFPPPVRRVDIPKASGGTRPLGIPTVADRIAQEVVRRYLEPLLEPAVPRGLLRIPTRPIGDRRGSERHDSDAGARTGSSISISRPSSTPSVTICLLRAVRKHTTCPLGAVVHRAVAEGPDPIGGWQPGASRAGTPQGSVSSARSCRICFCTTCSTDGWIESYRTFGSSGMLTISSATVGPSARRSRCSAS